MWIYELPNQQSDTKQHTKRKIILFFFDDLTTSFGLFF